MFKTCNHCRERARWRRLDPEFLATLSRPALGATRHIPYTDTDSEINVDYNGPAMGATRRIPDTDSESNYEYTEIDNIIRLSSSAAAAAAASSSSSAGYFVAEPDPEPEPEGA